MLYAVDHRDGIPATNWIAHDDASVYISNDHDVLVIVLGISCGFNQIESYQVTERLDFTLKCTRLGSEMPHLRLHA